MGNNKPLRILQIIGIVCGGGVEAVIMNYYRNIDRNCVQFDFIVDGKEKSLLDDEIKSLGGRVYHVTPYKENIFRYMYEIYQILKKNEYGIIHDNMNTMALFSLFPAWLAGAPVRILHNHTTNAVEDGRKYYMKKILRPFAPFFANRYLACSDFAGRWMYGKKMMLSGRVRVINNAIDLDRFAYNPEKRIKLRRELHINDDEIVIGHVGRIAPQKNHRFLLEIFADFYKHHQNAYLLLIGDGPLREQVIEKINELGIAGRVKLLGLKQNVYDYYNAMDVFVLPSLYEGLSVVTVEAQANGVPACVSAAIPEEAVVLHNVCRLSLSEEISVWRENIESLLGKRISSGKESLARVGFSITREAAKLGDYYQKIYDKESD